MAFSPNYFKLREQRMQLPVSNYLDDLEAKLRAKQVVIVEGETGSGKTTQVRPDLLRCNRLQHAGKRAKARQNGC
jgi:HrpA-like RNA helicase